MSTEKSKESIQLIYVRWSAEDLKVCSLCGAPIKYLYNDGGRTVITLQGKIKLFTCYYACTDKACKLSRPFTLPQEIVLPYKHYGLDVWHWVVTSYIEFHDAYNTIAKRLKAYYGLDISPNTVKAIIETFLVASSQEAAQETRQQVRESGRIYLALDGQRPNNSESGLWLFIDTLTDRILHMEYLKSANSEVLIEIFRKIEEKYGVLIEAVLSDHQLSIIKAVKEGLPDVPHQFCHYHFLKNLQRTVNALDSHLHLELSITINRLYINHLPASVAQHTIHGRQLNLQEWVAPIGRDLNRLLQERTRDFDIFAGFDLYEHLTQYVDLLETLLKIASPQKRLYGLIKRTISAIQEILFRQSPLYNKLQTLIPMFHQARGILGSNPAPKEQLRRQADRWQGGLRDLHKTTTGHDMAPNLKYQQITAKSPLGNIFAEWFRLYSTHERGLFQYLQKPGLPRSNVALEKIFSLEVSHFRMASGKAQVGNMVRVKGGEVCIVLQNYDPDLINQVLLKQDTQAMKSTLEQFRQRHQQQSASWHTKSSKDPEIYQLIKKTHKLLSYP